MSTVVVRLIGVGLVVIAAAMLWGPVRRVVAVDSCLDHGGSFDYQRDECDFTQAHPYLPYYGGRSYVRFRVAGAIGVIGVLVIIFPRGFGAKD